MSFAEIVVCVLVVVTTVLVIATAILQIRAKEALTRANLLGPLVCLAFPLLILAKLIHSWSTTGFDLGELILALIAVAGVWIVGSVGSFVMGRSLYGVTVVDLRDAG